MFITWRLQQDNDPKHASRVTKSFIFEKRICIIDWPSNSPGLNPVENMWYIITNNVEKSMQRNVDELRDLWSKNSSGNGQKYYYVYETGMWVGFRKITVV